MKIVHRISFAKSEIIESELDRLAVKYQRSPALHGHYVVTLEMSETDARWPEVAYLTGTGKTLDLLDTRFTNEEILSAEWVRLVPRFLRDYPQPKEAEEDWAWRKATYENVCPRCGVGYRQKAPFRIAREPRLGKHDFMCLFWTYTVFCTPSVVEALQAQQLQGYEVWKAIIHDTGQPSQVISQLLFPTVAGPEKCWTCGITKYAFHMRGYMHLQRKALRPGVDFQLTHEWFGSDTRWGYQEILVSNRMAKLILERRWRGVALKPVELV
jgi:hypothetical protein